MARASRTIFAASLALATLIATDAIAHPLKPEEEARIKPAGKPVDCLPLQSVQDSRVRDDQTIDFYASNRRVYRNRLPQSCPQLGSEGRFAFKTSLQQLCSVDIITVLTGPGLTRGASCGLGKFQPITGAPR